MATLHLQVIGGLCSRWRAVLGSVAYCEATDKELVVHWPLMEHGERIGPRPFPTRMSDIWHHPFEETQAGGKFRKGPDLSVDGDVWMRECHWTPFLPYITRPIRSYLLPFTLKPELREWVCKELEREGMMGPTVGVMIRRHDRVGTTTEPAWFVDRMNEIIELCPEVRFYLAADMPEVDKLIYAEFPGRVSALKHGTDYAWDLQGIKRVAADLYILAACDWVVGSIWSTYCQMISLMRGAELVGSHKQPYSTKGGRYETPHDRPKDNDRELMRVLECS